MAERRRKGRPFARRQADFRERGFCESAGGGLPSHVKFARSARRVRRRPRGDTVVTRVSRLCRGNGERPHGDTVI